MTVNRSGRTAVNEWPVDTNAYAVQRNVAMNDALSVYPGLLSVPRTRSKVLAVIEFGFACFKPLEVLRALSNTAAAENLVG